MNARFVDVHNELGLKSAQVAIATCRLANLKNSRQHENSALFDIVSCSS